VTWDFGGIWDIEELGTFEHFKYPTSPGISTSTKLKAIMQTREGKRGTGMFVVGINTDYVLSINLYKIVLSGQPVCVHVYIYVPRPNIQ